MHQVKRSLAALVQSVEAAGVKGFLAEEEARALYHYAAQQAPSGPCLEIGSYCGKSTLFLAAACAQHNQVVYAVDHHRGSQEHQPGELYHDPALMNTTEEVFDSFPAFRRNVQQFGFSDSVVPIVFRSERLAPIWSQPLSLVFVDGGHSASQALQDCLGWADKVQPGGVLAVHDIYLSELEGGQAPRLALNQLMASEHFIWERKVGSLVMVRRKRAAFNPRST